MRSQSELVGISLLAFGLALPALMETSRSIKIGVLNDASCPYFDNASERTVGFRRRHPDLKVEIIIQEQLTGVEHAGSA